MKKSLLVLLSLFFVVLLTGSVAAQSVFNEDYNALPTGGVIGGQTGWHDDGSGPIITSGNGVNGSIGLAAYGNGFTWTGHPFNWNDATLQKVIFGMDFQASSTATFDDDRIGWTISNSDVANSGNHFGVQLDNPDGGIATFWRLSDGTTRIQSPIAALSGITANTWYRLRATITKLTSTSAQIDVSLQALDASGNPTGTPITGQVTNTSTWAAGAPGTGYFAPTSMWPFFKNYTTAAGAADNAYFEIVSGVATPAITTSGTLTTFSTQPGVPSAAQTYTVSGSNLTADISITPPAGYELSTNGTDFFPTLTLTQSGGTVNSTPVDVRLTGASAGFFSGNIAHTSSGATTQNVALSGTVAPQYTLTAGNDGNGTVTLNPAGGSYSGGTTVTLTPVPNSSYVFDSWTGPNAGDVVNTAGVYTIVMNGNKSVTATFVVSAASWTAYNDCVYRASEQYIGANVTTFGIGSGFSGSTTGSLLQQANGASTGVTATFTQSGGVVWQADAASGGSDPNVGTDAYNTFHGIADMTGVIYYGSAGWYVDLTFTGLDPDKEYTFVTSANRGGSSYTTRLSAYIIGGATSFTNASTAGVTAPAPDSVIFSTGYNTINGYVARWTNIRSGPDGSFYVRARAGSAEYRAYAFDVFTLAEVVGTAPAISISGGLTPFSSQPGVPSTAQTYTVSGVNLTDNILITPPAGYQLSTNGADYFSTLTLTETGGTVNSTTVHVRLSNPAEGTFNGDITHTSTGATTQNVTVSGTVDNTFTATFQYGTSGYIGSQDAFIRGTTEGNTSFGASDNFEWDDNTGTTTDEAALILFGSIFESEGGPIPDGSVITGATLTYRLSSVSGAQGSNGLVHESLVDWVASSVTWNNFGEDPGAQAEEYSATKVTDAPATAANTIYTIDVTPSLQRWSDGTANYGWIILPGGTDGVNVFSNEHTTIADRPLLTVVYEPVTGPYISAVAALTPFGTQPSVPSVAQTYTVSGINLTADIDIAAPTGFQLSTNGTDYSSALTLVQSGGTVASTTVYAQLNSATTGSFGGNIVHTSAGATTKNVAVSGEVADGFAFRFGSGPGNITFGNNASLALAQITLETWFKREGAGTAASTGTGGVSAIPLVTKGRGEADDDDRDMNYFFGIRASDNVLAADFEEGAGGIDPGLNHPVYGVTPIVNGTWYHAAVTYDGNKWQLFLNGALETELVVGQPLRADCIQHAGLGVAMTSTGAPEGHFDGVLDEVRIWNYARTLNEIQSTIESELTSAAGLVGRWGLNEGSGTTVQNSAGSPIDGTVTGTGWSWTAGASMDINLAPDQPTLPNPANAATGVSTSPSLQVSVTDPDADAMTVKFYGRPKANVGEDFTIVAIPDAQNYTMAGGTLAKFTAQTNWCVNQQASRNIVFAPMLGDITQNNVDAEWQRSQTAMSTLEGVLPGLPNGIPYGISLGNHDMVGSSTTLYNSYFGSARFTGRSYYGGHYGSDNNNSYQLFSAGGMEFIGIHLGGGDQTPSPAVLSWADGVLKANSARRAVVVNHWIINTGNPAGFSAPGQAVFDSLKDNSNLFLMLCGHVHGEGRRTDTGTNGNTIHTILSDYQNDLEGNGWLRILTFSPANNQITVESYSPYLSQSNWGVAPYTLAYNMSGSSFTLLGTESGVASGSTASMGWSSLSNLTEYEWYATVSDGNTTVTGPNWSFTTEEEATSGETVAAGLPNTVYNFPTGGASMSFSTLPAGGGNVTVTRHSGTPPGGASLPGGASFLHIWYEITSTMPANSFSATVTVDVTGITGFTAQTNVLYYSTASSEWIPVGGTYNPGANTFTFTATHFTDFGFAGATAGAFDLYLASSATGTSSAAFRPTAAWGGDYPGRQNDWSFTGAQTQEVYIVPEVGAQFGSCDFTVDWNDQVLRFIDVDFNGSVFNGATTTEDTAGLQGGVHVTATLGSNVGPITSGQYVARIVLEVIKPGSSGLTVTGCSFLNRPDLTTIFVTAHDALHGAYLGDVYGTDSTAGDGKVDGDDLAEWSYAYWSGVPGYVHQKTYYRARFDIGPTADGYLFTLPTKDEKIDFEDLVVFAMSYNVSARHQIAKPGVLPTEPMDVSTGQPAIAAGQTVIPVVLGGTVTDLRALSLELTGRYGKFLGVEAGNMLNARKVEPVIMSTQANGRLLVDFALPASEEPCINAAGEVVKLRFEGSANVGVSAARARDAFNRTLPIVAKGAEKGLPTTYALDQNYPNPFNPSTMVSYQLPAISQVTIKIYDVIGREVATLVNDVQEAGYYTVQWNGRNNSGASLSSGLYFCRMQAGDFSALNKMMLVK